MSSLLDEVVNAFPVSRACIQAHRQAQGRNRSEAVSLSTQGIIKEPDTDLGVLVDANGRASQEGGDGSDAAAREADQSLQLWAMIAEGSRVPFKASRLLVAGEEGLGQNYFGSALLHALEALPCHPLGLPTLLADDSARSPEEALVRRITEARRSAPAVLFLPHLQMWWEAAHNNLRVTLWMLLEDLPADLPLFLLATADVPVTDVDPSALDIFDGNVFELSAPFLEDRRLLFDRARRAMMTKPAVEKGKGKVYEELPLAPPPEPPAPTEYDLRMQAASEEASLRSLRMFLRDKVLLKLLNDKKWSPFSKPLQSMYPDMAFSYPMDLSTMLWNLDEGRYPTVDSF